MSKSQMTKEQFSISTASSIMKANSQTLSTRIDNKRSANDSRIKHVKISPQQLQVLLDSARDGKPFYEICGKQQNTGK